MIIHEQPTAAPVCSQKDLVMRIEEISEARIRRLLLSRSRDAYLTGGN